MSRILVVDDESLMREFITDSLQAHGHEVDATPDGLRALDLLKTETYDVILSDYKMPKLSGLELLRQVMVKAPDTKVIIMTAYGTIENAVEAMRTGAFDYLTKPFSVDEVLHVVNRAIEFRDLQRENRIMRTELEEKYSHRNLIGESPAMQKVFELVNAVSQSRSTVLVIGKSGSGKEMVARAIHYASPRKNGPFIKTNCAALPSELMESELFGHEKGAFTGAVRRYRGRFERANGGTLLLDEISEMSPQLQAKLLRVLQEREFEPVGSTETVQVDVRIIATTNRDLETMIQRGEFREDLYYRLNVITINLPQLRDRKSDIPLLASHFLEKYNHENGKAVESIAEDVLDQWRGYDWPGNVRELENAVERAVVMCTGKIISLDDTGMPGLLSRAAGQDSAGISAGRTIADMERELIMKTLESQGGNRTTTAELLDISVRTLRNKLAQYGKMDAYK
jgi:DNA-binding NtrC family response regulator